MDMKIRGMYLIPRISVLQWFSSERFLSFDERSGTFTTTNQCYIEDYPVRILADAFTVTTVARVHADNLALVDKQRHADLRTGL